MKFGTKQNLLVITKGNEMAEKLIILDGSMGAELARRGYGKSDGIWSAKALVDAPEMVAEVHRDYIKSGCRVITTNSYSTIPSYLDKGDLEDRYQELTALAGQIAREVSDESDEEVLVAGCLPPLDVSYRPDLVPSDEESLPIYKNLVEALDPFVDFFLCETMSLAREGKNAVSAARSFSSRSLPVWVAWTLADDGSPGLRSGESIFEAYKAVEPFDPDAFLFNCTDPQAITLGFTQLLELTDKPIGGYPNSFHVPEGWTLDNEISVERRELQTQEFVDLGEKWRSMGASIIGGCCGVGPGHLKAFCCQTS